MEITLSKYAGFCEGVARAYEMVEKIAKDPDIKRPIAVLGSLVHNSDVVAHHISGFWICYAGIFPLGLGCSFHSAFLCDARHE